MLYVDCLLCNYNEIRKVIIFLLKFDFVDIDIEDDIYIKKCVLIIEWGYYLMKLWLEKS